MTIKKKRGGGGIISRIKGNRRVRRQRNQIKKNAPSKSSATESLRKSATPAAPRAEVRKGRIAQGGLKLRAPEMRGVTAPRARSASAAARRQTFGSDPSGAVARERTRERERAEANERNRRLSRNEMMGSYHEPAGQNKNQQRGTQKAAKKKNKTNRSVTPPYRRIWGS